MRHDSHRWDVVHVVRRYMVWLLTVKPVAGEATARCVFLPQLSLLSDPRRNGGLIQHPVAQRCGKKLAPVPVA